MSLAALALLATFFSATNASAQQLESVLVLPSSRAGIDQAAGRDVLAAVTEVFEEAGVTVRRGRDGECVDDPNSGCVEEVDAARASAALIITVDPAGPARDVPIVSLNLLYGERQLTLTEQIPEGDSEARTLYQTLAAQALGRWGSAELTTLTVGGSPEGAAVQIGRLLGQLPFTARVQPGPHELIVRAPGFETHHETIQVPSQPEYALSIHLEPEGDANGN
ncbi:MAG: PEGA domain-containing protein, partial [Myxococcota bacterium]